MAKYMDNLGAYDMAESTAAISTGVGIELSADAGRAKTGRNPIV